MPERQGGDGPRHSIMTIVARRGFALIGGNDAKWVNASLYSNHFVDAYSLALIVVTEHGWTDLSTGWGAAEPRLRPGLVCGGNR